MSGKRRYELDINGKHFTVAVNNFTTDGAELEVNGANYLVGVKDITTEVRPYRPPPRTIPMPLPVHHGAQGKTRVVAPIPGQVVGVQIKPGDRINIGQPLIKLEAMKMVNTIRSTAAGVVESISVHVGDVVNQHQEMLIIR